MLRATLILSLTAIAGAACAQTPPPESQRVAAASSMVWGSSAVSRPAGWYGSDEARRLALQVIAHQSPQGGWPKNTDLFAPPAPDADPALTNTIDNNATTLPLAFLARVIEAGDSTPRAAFDRGLDYLLAAQYPNGGWPQYAPLRGGYHDAVTYNDDAMVRVLRLLDEVAQTKPPYGFVDGARREQAAQAVRRGVDALLKSQVRQDGRRTVWSAQHDPVTLAPVGARRFEPASLSGQESVGLVRFLMGIDPPGPDVIAAVEGAVAWFRATALYDIRIESFTDAEGQADRRVVPAPGEGPLWARFYGLEDNRPLFTGRDGVPRPALADIERERRAGYNYYGDWAKTLLERDYPAWRARLARPN